MQIQRISGKIVLVDDHSYEKTLLEKALLSKNWEINVEYFHSPERALEYLEHTSDDIFLMLSDIEMPEMSGLDFKKTLDGDKNLLLKAIPFIFVSSSASREEVEEAYDYGVQGYFRKPFSIEEQANMLDTIIRYWIISMQPK